MFKVFLGSTFKDLYEHRKAVLDAIIRLGCAPVAMEWFGARAGTPIDECLKAVGDCDLYVGLIGHCYGHVPDGEAVSITEAEYEAAVAKELPRLLFVASDDFLMPASIQESEVQRQKQQEFRKRVLASGTTQWFGNDKGTLAARVGEALSRESAKHSLSQSPEPATAPVFLPKKGLCVGREEEVARICRAVLAEEPEPVVVLGPPGIGKSKVTIAALHDQEVKVRFGERRWFVRLETAPEPAAIPGQVALAIGVRPGPDLEARVLSALAAGPGLLVLDNTETPWWRDAAGTEAVLETLAQVPGLALVCSVRSQRAPHRPDWGTTILVPGLAEPAGCELFLRRAGERHAASPILPGLLADMDGVPLAIVLLAGQIRADETGLERVATAWREKRTELLAARKDATHRLDSYEVSLALSLASAPMTPAARTLYALMGRLPAGIADEATNALLPGDGPAALATLGDLGLAFDDGGRMRMLAPIRAHAEQQHISHDLIELLIAYWIRLASKYGSQVGISNNANAITLLAVEWANLQVALRLGFAGKSISAIDAASALGAFIAITGIGEAKILSEARAVAIAIDDQNRIANIDERLSDIAIIRSDAKLAEIYLNEAYEIYLDSGNPHGQANCLARLGEIARRQSDYSMAARFCRKARKLFQLCDDDMGVANCTVNLGEIALARKRLLSAQWHFNNAFTIYSSIKHEIGQAQCWFALGEVAFWETDYAKARESFQIAGNLFRKLGSTLGLANSLRGLADIALRNSNHVLAGEQYGTALPLYRQVGDVLGVANCLKGIGDVRLVKGELGLARSDFLDALGLYRRIESYFGAGWTLVRLSRLATADERIELVREARVLWEAINRPDLVAGLEREFGAGREG